LQIKQKQEWLIERKQEFNNQSNQKEFFDLSGKSDEVCARTSTAQIQRDQQIRISKVENISGPSVNKRLYDNNEISSGIEERFKNIEQYASIIYPPIPIDIYQRIKILEDKILGYESQKNSNNISNIEDKEEQLEVPTHTTKIQKGKSKKNKVPEVSAPVPVVRAALASPIEEVCYVLNDQFLSILKSPEYLQQRIEELQKLLLEKSQKKQLKDEIKQTS
jgi:hypothetical protein